MDDDELDQSLIFIFWSVRKETLVVSLQQEQQYCHIYNP